MSNLAFVFLITEAKTDINVPLAILWQVLSLHQGDTKHPSPHLVLHRILLRFTRTLVWCGLVLLQDKDTHRHSLTWHLIRFTGFMKVGQRFTLYSTSLCEHISTSLLTGKPHHVGSWRERKRGTSASSQMSLAVTVPLITGFQTECGEAGHLPYCTRDSRQQWVMMQTTQLSYQQIMHTCCMYGKHQSLLHVGKFKQSWFDWQNNKSYLIKWIFKSYKDVLHSRTLWKSKTSPANNPLLLPCVTEGMREGERKALICFHVRVPVRPCGDRPGL